jgi:N-acetylmuramoyl-L-alanine amidase
VRVGLLLGLAVAGHGFAISATPPTVRSLDVAERDARTVVTMRLDGPVEAEVRTLDRPPRIVVDLPALRWPSMTPPKGGLVSGLRWGLAEPGRARLVIDLAAPAAVSGPVRRAEGHGVALEFHLVPASAAAFAALAAQQVAAAAAARPGGSSSSAPLVVIDPGHGGRDPGAVVAGLREKDITLDVSRMLARSLVGRGFRVMLTRESDVFLSLADRVEVARRAGASLLLSIHADRALAGDASGASVYLLGAEPSDAEAAALAEQENAEGGFAGIDPAEGSDVSRLLSVLIRRETAMESARLGPSLVAALAARVPVLPGRPLRSAGFRVLKAPEVPSALVELGFLSSAADRARLTDPAWRAEAVAALADGIEAWASSAKSVDCVARPCTGRD